MMPPRVYLARLESLRDQIDRGETNAQIRTAWEQLLVVLLNALTAHPSINYLPFLEMATRKVKIPTVALTGSPCPKRPAVRLDASAAADVAKGRLAWHTVAAPLAIARPYSSAVLAVGGQISQINNNTK